MWRNAVVLACMVLAQCSDDDVDEDDARTCAELVSVDGAPSGIDECLTEHAPDYYRLAPVECAITVSDGLVCATPEACPSPDDDTATRACGEGVLCLWGRVGGLSACECRRPCARDDECGEGFACVCTGLVGVSQCVAAECRGDADCAGGRCAIARDDCGTPLFIACRDEGDACTTNDDCGDPGGAFRCTRSRGEWGCAGSNTCD